VDEEFYGLKLLRVFKTFDEKIMNRNALDVLANEPADDKLILPQTYLQYQSIDSFFSIIFPLNSKQLKNLSKI